MSAVPLLPDLLARRAGAVPDEVALLVDGAGRLTYADWARRSAAFARGLRARGLGRGDRLGLLFDNEHLVDYAVAYLGCARTGIAAVPLPAGTPVAQLTGTLADAAVAAVVRAGDLTPPAGLTGTIPFPLIGQGQDEGPFPTEGTADDLIEIIYTSGTTGARKGVAASHGNVVEDWTRDEPAGYPQRYLLHAMPLGTNAGQVTLRGALRWPPTTIVLPRFDQARFRALVAEYEVTSTVLVPAMALWLAAGTPTGVTLPSVRAVTVTAAALPAAGFAALARIFPHAELFNSYSSTESWPARTNTRYDPTRPGSVGRPLPGQQVRVTDPTGRPCPPGRDGDVWLRVQPGTSARRYLDHPAGDGVFADRWVATGDLGHLDAEGYLYLTGRRGELVSVGGHNVSTWEVEAVLHEHPAVAQAAAVGLPHEILGQTLAAAVVANRAAGPVDAAELRAFVAARLAAHKVPAVVVFVPELPRTVTHKVPADEVRALITEARRAEPVPPSTDDERTLLAIWTQVLGRHDLGVQDDFLAAGGHSLAAFEIMGRARVAFGLDLPRTFVLDRATVAAQAELVGVVRASGATAPPPLVRRPRPR